MKDIYYAEKVAPELSADFNPFWEDFTEHNSGTWLDDFLIFPVDGYRSKTNDLLDRIIENAEEAGEADIDFTDFTLYYRNYTDYITRTFNPVKKLNTREIHRIKVLFEKYLTAHFTADSAEAAAEIMTILSGEKWKTYPLIGYCQGDFRTAIYKAAEHTEAGLDELNTMFWNGGDGYKIYYNGEPDVCAYTTKWNDEEVREELANIIGCKPTELFFDEEEAAEALNAAKLAALERETGTPV